MSKLFMPRRSQPLTGRASSHATIRQRHSSELRDPMQLRHGEQAWGPSDVAGGLPRSAFGSHQTPSFPSYRWCTRPAGSQASACLGLDVEKGWHYVFTITCADAPPAPLVSLNAALEGCNSDFIPISEAVPVPNAYILGFARAHVLRESGWRDVLRGPAFSPGFILQTK